ncbi:hypothetical protein [Paenibacillus montanisoli]|uniref:Uncharacterized protein n=1 Tax=Paenibacillus montanisoli TaxID=2081970 RepID=A0A328U8L1_9BACL|nr:hypothetical protein [Paenibacillus montanisoli]RAP78173.1 hypothetical protein DL346_07005 [Paenibacillus montanisoli]
MRSPRVAFAVMGSLMTFVFLLLVNQLTSPGYFWVIHPAFALFQWPIAMYFAAAGRIKPYSAVASLLIILYLFLENMSHSPGHPWFLYPSLAIIWWPVLMYAGRYAGTLRMALIGSFFIIVSYGLLNLLLSPAFPWVIFPAYAALWWPMSIYFSRSRKWFEFALCASLLTSALFITLNAASSPDQIWAIYPIFAVVWWPLSMHFYAKRPPV